MEIFGRDEKYAGKLKDGVLYLERTKEDYSQRFCGFSIKKNVIVKAEKFGAYHVCITYQNKKYHCPIRYFKNSGKVWKAIKEDPELFVSISDMQNFEKREVKR